MTEEEWMASESPVPLLGYLNADGSSRKLLLYASALGSLRPDELETLGEWFAAVEAVLVNEQMPKALDDLQEYMEGESSFLAGHGSLESRAYHAVLYHVVSCQWLYDPLELDVNYALPSSADYTALRRAAVGLVNEIYGNPFRPAAFDPAWRTDTAVSLARGMYESRDFGAMPILADALQDAGCDSAEVLDHCRSANAVHVRGCWVIDLVLNKF